jgi:hypothetical protein
VTDQTRTFAYTFRVTRAERRALDKLARLAGYKKTADYVRQVSLGHALRGAESKEGEAASVKSRPAQDPHTNRMEL